MFWANISTQVRELTLTFISQIYIQVRHAEFELTLGLDMLS